MWRQPVNETGKAPVRLAEPEEWLVFDFEMGSSGVQTEHIQPSPTPTVHRRLNKKIEKRAVSASAARTHKQLQRGWTAELNTPRTRYDRLTRAIATQSQSHSSRVRPATSAPRRTRRSMAHHASSPALARLVQAENARRIPTLTTIRSNQYLPLVKQFTRPDPVGSTGLHANVARLQEQLRVVGVGTRQDEGGAPVVRKRPRKQSKDWRTGQKQQRQQQQERPQEEPAREERALPFSQTRLLRRMKEKVEFYKQNKLEREEMLERVERRRREQKKKEKNKSVAILKSNKRLAGQRTPAFVESARELLRKKERAVAERIQRRQREQALLEERRANQLMEELRTKSWYHELRRKEREQSRSFLRMRRFWLRVVTAGPILATMMKAAQESIDRVARLETIARAAAQVGIKQKEKAKLALAVIVRALRFWMRKRRFWRRRKALECICRVLKLSNMGIETRLGLRGSSVGGRVTVLQRWWRHVRVVIAAHRKLLLLFFKKRERILLSERQRRVRLGGTECPPSPSRSPRLSRRRSSTEASPRADFSFPRLERARTPQNRRSTSVAWAQSPSPRSPSRLSSRRRSLSVSPGLSPLSRVQKLPADRRKKAVESVLHRVRRRAKVALRRYFAQQKQWLKQHRMSLDLARAKDVLSNEKAAARLVETQPKPPSQRFLPSVTEMDSAVQMALQQWMSERLDKDIRQASTPGDVPSPVVPPRKTVRFSERTVVPNSPRIDVVISDNPNT